MSGSILKGSIPDIRRRDSLPADDRQDPNPSVQAREYVLVLMKWRQGAWQPSMLNVPGFSTWAAANAQGLLWKNYANIDLQERHDYHIVAVS